ncbi:MAG: cytochrome c biogenesis protein CcsA [Acidobacteria bacterium]|nr:cytochrome c biogenesis protein CcsA [Acidobacteriota bacterium]
MTLGLLNAAAILCYLISVGGYLGLLLGRRPAFGRLATGSLLLGMAVHFLALVHRSTVTGGVPYKDFYGSASLFAWMIALVCLLLELRHKQKAMSLFLVTIAVVLQITSAILQNIPVGARAGVAGWLFAFHVNVTMFAYAAYAISFIASMMYLIQYGRLRARRPGGWLSLLPSLDLLERVNLTSAAIGVVALSTGILTGAIWARTAWQDTPLHWDAKITWSLLTLIIYTLYIIVQKRKGWRGPRSALVAVGGFLVVVFSYTVVNLYFSKSHTFF